MTNRIINILPAITVLFIAFLTPFFFLPWTPELFEFNKQPLIVLGSSLALLLVLILSLVRGKISLPRSFVHTAAFLAVATVFLASVFSQNKIMSFLGFGFGSHEAFLTAMALLFLYLAVVIYFDHRYIMWLLRTVMLSGIFVGLITSIAVSGLFSSVISPDFSTIGAPSSTGLFLLAALAVSIGGAMFWTGLWQKFAVISSVFIFLSGMLIFQDTLWLIFGISALFMLVLHLFHLRKASSSILSTVFLGSFIGLATGFFLFAPLNGLIVSSLEVSPSLSMSVDIAQQSLLESPLFGIGPTNWGDAYNLYFPVELNQGNFWNVSFAQAGSKFATLPVTGGIFSFLAWIFFVVLLGVAGFKNGYLASHGLIKNMFGLKTLMAIIRHKKAAAFGGEESAVLPSASTDIFFPAFFAWIILLLGQIFLTSNITLETFFWLFGAVLLVPRNRKNIIPAVINNEAYENGGIKLSKDSLAFQIVALAVAALLIVSISMGLIFVRRYAGVKAYRNAVSQSEQNNKKEAIENLKFAVRMEPVNSFYLRFLSNVALTAFVEESSIQEEPDKERIERLNDYSSLAASSIEQVILAEPKHVQNWEQRAIVYRTLMRYGVPGMEEKINESFTKAIELAPQNPSYMTEFGNVQFIAWNKAESEGMPGKDNDRFFNDAEKYFKKAIELKADYSEAHLGLGMLYLRKQNYEEAEKEFRIVVALIPASSDAHYLLGLTLDGKGNKADALKEFELLAKYNPENEEIKKIIENIKAGKPALEGIGNQIPENDN